MKFVVKKKLCLMFLSLVLLLSFFLDCIPVSAVTATTAEPGLQTDVYYYIRNTKTGQYLYYNSTSNALGCSLTKPSGSQYKFKLKNNTTGTFNIVSYSGHYLQIDSSNKVSMNSSYVSSSRNLFFIKRYGNYGTYSIQNGYTNKYLSSDATQTTKLVESSTFSADLDANSVKVSRSLWGFERADYGTAYTYSHYNTIFDRSDENNSNFKSVFSGIGYTSNSLTNSNVATVFSRLQTASVLISAGHGESNGSGSIISHSGNDIRVSGGVSTNRYINDLGKNSLAQSRCIVYMHCNSGTTYLGGNLVSATYAKGAHCVIGFKREVRCDVATRWMKAFTDRAKQTNVTIYECIVAANFATKVYADSVSGKLSQSHSISMSDIKYVGDVYARINY